MRWSRTERYGNRHASQALTESGLLLEVMPGGAFHNSPWYWYVTPVDQEAAIASGTTATSEAEAKKLAEAAAS